MMSKKILIIALIIQIIAGEEQYYIKINDKEFEFEFKDTEVANQIKSKLPFTVKMTNLNGNEVYYQFSGESFTPNHKAVGTINMGDIYLYRSNFLVLFYKTFTTSYSYTEIGKLKDATGLDTIIGSSDIEVEWFKANTEAQSTTIITTEVTKNTQIPEKTEEPEETDEYIIPKVSFQNNIKINYIILLLLALFLF